jgi:hypothetical protein
VLCSPDPRDAATGVVLSLTAPLPRTDPPQPPGAQAWFVELTDGSTCQPITGMGREIEGMSEQYVCRFAASDADAVLGGLDASQPVWTIQKVLLNKKVEPQTIKAATIAPVKTVWQ